MLFRRCYFILVVVLGLANLAMGQEPLLRHYTQIDQLPSNTVYDIAQTREGFLWIATENGLCRYDGHRFQRFHFDELKDDVIIRVKAHGDTIGVQNLSQELIFIDNNGNLIRKLAGGKEGILNWEIDQKANVWVGQQRIGYRGGRIGVVPPGESTVNIVDENSLYLLSMEWSQGPQPGNLLVGGSKGLRAISTEVPGYQIEQVFEIRDELIALRFFFPDNHIFFACREEKLERMGANLLMGFNGSNIQPVRLEGVSATQFYDLRRTSQGILYLATDNGVWELTGLAPFHYQAKEQILAQEQISCIFEDREGNIWFASLSQGMYKLPFPIPRRFPLPLSIRSTVNNHFVDLINVNDSAILAVTNNGNLIHYDENELQNLTSVPIPFPDLRGIFSTPNHHFLFGPSELIRVDRTTDAARLNLTNYTRTNQTFKYLYNVKTMASDGNRLWMGSHGDVIEFPIASTEGEAIHESRTHAMSFDFHRDLLWLGCGSGLYAYQGGETELYRDGRGRSLDKFVNHILLGEDSLVLVGTQGNGLWKVEGDRLEQIPAPPNSDFKSVIDMVRDGPLVWIITDRGVFRLDIRENFWMRVAQQIPNPQALALTRSHIWVSAFDHVIQIPREQSNDLPFKLRVEEINLFDENGAPLPFAAEMPARTDRLELTFSALSFRRPATYQYRINDRPWQNIGAASLTLASLSPGGYNIELRGILDNGLTTAKTRVEFKIAYPFHQTSGFFVLLGLGTVLLTFGLVTLRNRQRVRNIRREQQTTELQEQITDLQLQALRAQINPHFVFNSMNAIQHLLLDEQEEKALVYLADFARLIRMAFESAPEHLISLTREIEFIRLYLRLEELRFRDRVTVELTVDEALDTDALKVPGMTVQPFVENAFVHGLMHKEDPGHLQVHFGPSTRPGFLHCRIEDDGVGREMAEELGAWRKEHQSLGISITQERLELTSQLLERDRFEFEIEDLKDSQGRPQGTRVHLFIPTST